MEMVVRLRSIPVGNGRLDTDIAHSNLPIVRGARIFGSDEPQVILTLAIHQSDLKKFQFQCAKNTSGGVPGYQIWGLKMIGTRRAK